MRLATFETDGSTRLGIVRDDDPSTLVEVGAARTPEVPADLLSLIAAGEPAWRAAASVARDNRDRANGVRRLADVRLRAPIVHPGKILCLAGNYRAHIAESGYAVPADADVITPQCFLKPSSTLTGDGADVTLAPDNVAVGWEVELAVVIGRGGRRIQAQAAMAHVFGYTVLNDLSERRVHANVAQRKVRENDRFFDWLAGKWYDGFAPCGPWIVTADDVPDPHALEMRLWVNGELKQRGHTDDMIFRIPELIAWTSSIMTLEPGDIISTGTPVGAGIGGASALSAGDTIVCEIDRIGRLTTRMRAAG